MNKCIVVPAGSRRRQVVEGRPQFGVPDRRRVCNLVPQTGSHTAEDMLLLAAHKTQSVGEGES